MLETFHCRECNILLVYRYKGCVSVVQTCEHYNKIKFGELRLKKPFATATHYVPEKEGKTRADVVHGFDTLFGRTFCGVIVTRFGRWLVDKNDKPENVSCKKCLKKL